MSASNEFIVGQGFIVVIFAIFLGLAISQFFPFKNYPLETKFGIDRISKILNICIVFLIIYIILHMLNIIEVPKRISDNYQNLGVMLSALVATAAVRKSIENTNKLEKLKEKRELFDKRMSFYNNSKYILNKIKSKNLNYDDINSFSFNTASVNLFFEEDIISLINDLEMRCLNYMDLVTEIDWIKEDLENIKSDMYELHMELSKKIKYPSGQNILTKRKYDDKQKEFEKLNKKLKEKKIELNEYCNQTIKIQKEFEHRFETYLKLSF